MDRIQALLETREDFHVIAHAGSGKTTAFLRCLKSLPLERRTLLLEYNRDLKADARQKVQELQIGHFCSADNWDGVLVTYFDPSAPQVDFEVAMCRVLRSDARPLQALDFEILAIDEAQDMTEVFFRFAHKLLRCAEEQRGQKPQLVLLGDARQTVYGWRGASCEYLVQPALWLPRNLEQRVSLATVYRFGSVVAAFVNRVFRGVFGDAIWPEDMRSARQGGSVTLVRTSGNAGSRRAAELYTAAARRGQVAVLTYSTRNDNSLLWGTLELASVLGAPRVALEDCEGSTGPVLQTLHTSKGRQFGTTVLFLSPSQDWVTNGRLSEEKAMLLYVGLTRCTEALIVVESRDGVLPLSDEEAERTGAEVISEESWKPEPGSAVDFSSLSLAYADEIVMRRATPSVKEELHLLLQVRRELGSPCLPRCLQNILGVQSVRIRAEFKALGGVSALQPLLDWAQWPESRKATEPKGLDSAYQQLVAMALRSPTARRRLLPEHESALRAMPSDPSAWNWDAWLTLAELLPWLHFGHVRVERPSVEEQELLDRLYGIYLDTSRDLDPHVSMDLFGFRRAGVLRPTRELCLQEASGARVHVFVFDDADSTRLSDAVGALWFLGHLSAEMVCLHYLQRGARSHASLSPGATSSLRGILSRALVARAP